MNPLKTHGPTVIQFSGGRTSAFLLKQIVDAHGGKLPEDTKVFFENTGKEDELTLKFVNECDQRWNLGITWLEYRRDLKAVSPLKKIADAMLMAEYAPSLLDKQVGGDGTYEIVSYETASRNGEPFEAVIAQRGGILPSPRARYCSSELKTRTAHRFIRDRLQWEEWDTFLGIRADEPSRIATFRRNPHPETKSETVLVPLAEMKVTAKDVGKFWREQDFDLELPNMNGKTMHGNCDLCFLKPAKQVASLIQEKPERAIWWAKQEKIAEEFAHGNGSRFRIDRPSYARMMEYAGQQGDMFDPEEQSISCFCGD